MAKLKISASRVLSVDVTADGRLARSDDPADHARLWERFKRQVARG